MSPPPPPPTSTVRKSCGRLRQQAAGGGGHGGTAIGPPGGAPIDSPMNGELDAPPTHVPPPPPSWPLLHAKALPPLPVPRIMGIRRGLVAGGAASAASGGCHRPSGPDLQMLPAAAGEARPSTPGIGGVSGPQTSRDSVLGTVAAGGGPPLSDSRTPRLEKSNTEWMLWLVLPERLAQGPRGPGDARIVSCLSMSAQLRGNVKTSPLGESRLLGFGESRMESKLILTLPGRFLRLLSTREGEASWGNLSDRCGTGASSIQYWTASHNGCASRTEDLHACTRNAGEGCKGCASKVLAAATQTNDLGTSSAGVRSKQQDAAGKSACTGKQSGNSFNELCP